MKQTQKPKLLTLSALFLTAVLLFGSLPATAVAPLFETEETPTPLYEIEARRERNVKHFMMSDGTIQAIAYGDAVHRKDASGNWQDIDNTLSLQTENGVSHYTTPDGRARFAQGLQTNQPYFTVEEGATPSPLRG